MKQGYVIILSGCMLLPIGALMATKKDALKEYKAKRDFTKTNEPAPIRAKKSESKKFVIQKHAASHLHYDFRLEIDGVLVSWAVPKGPSLDPADKRLAVMTEDHPLEYARFEGVIPAGEYGGGTVMIWDTGTYENIKETKGKLVSMDQCLKNGRIEIVLHGKKLEGAYALVRFKGEKKQWLLIKMKDAHAKAGTDITESKPKSVVTGRTMEQITRAGVLFDGDCSTAACSHASPYAYPGHRARQASSLHLSGRGAQERTALARQVTADTTADKQKPAEKVKGKGNGKAKKTKSKSAKRTSR